MWRIKQLNWKALQVRCEIAYPPLSPPSDLESEVEREKWALQQAKLAAALQAKGQESKPGVRYRMCYHLPLHLTTVLRRRRERSRVSTKWDNCRLSVCLSKPVLIECCCTE